MAQIVSLLTFHVFSESPKPSFSEKALVVINLICLKGSKSYATPVVNPPAIFNSAVSRAEKQNQGCFSPWEITWFMWSSGCVTLIFRESRSTTINLRAMIVHSRTDVWDLCRTGRLEVTLVPVEISNCRVSFSVVIDVHCPRLIHCPKKSKKQKRCYWLITVVPPVMVVVWWIGIPNVYSEYHVCLPYKI